MRFITTRSNEVNKALDELAAGRLTLSPEEKLDNSDILVSELATLNMTQAYICDYLATIANLLNRQQ